VLNTGLSAGLGRVSEQCPPLRSLGKKSRSDFDAIVVQLSNAPIGYLYRC